MMNDSLEPEGAFPVTIRLRKSQEVRSVTQTIEPAVILHSTFVGDYELLAEIARGGMGIVYKARQRKLNRIVALKVTRAEHLASCEDLQRLDVEAMAAAQLDHPNIVPIYEVGEADGRRYFSMAFVEGESLAETLAAGPLLPYRAAELIKLVAQAVAYAHRHGVIHRDLKPSNILLDAGGMPRITDFGLAKCADTESGLTQVGQIMGTPSFMSPEQAEAKSDHVGPATDVYSLGATLYCLLTGRPPFQAATPLETIKQVVEREALSPRQLNHAIDRDLDTICLKCLQKRPERRYASATAWRRTCSDISRTDPSRPGRSDASKSWQDRAAAIRWWRRRFSAPR